MQKDESILNVNLFKEFVWQGPEMDSLKLSRALSIFIMRPLIQLVKLARQNRGDVLD